MQDPIRSNKTNFNIVITYYCQLRNIGLAKLSEEILDGLGHSLAVPSLSRHKNTGRTIAPNKAKEIISHFAQKIFQIETEKNLGPQLLRYLDDPELGFRELAISSKSNELVFEHQIDYKYLTPLFQAERNEVYIVTTWFNDFNVDFILDLKLNTYRDIKIKILLLHPNSIVGVQRSRAVGEKDFYARNKIIKSLETMSQHFIDHDNVEIRLYDQLPVFNGYIFTTKILCSWFFMDTLADKQNYLRINSDQKSNAIAKKFVEHCQKIWNLKSTKKFEIPKFEKLKKKWTNYLSFDLLHKLGSTNDNLDHFIGHWAMYYPFKYPKADIKSSNKYLNDIGLNVIHIFKKKISKVSNVYCCEMTYHGERQTTYKGIINLGLESDNYVTITLYGRKQKRVLHLVINNNAFRKDNYLGTYNVIYKKNKAGSGAGLTVLSRIKTPKPLPANFTPPPPCIIRLKDKENLDRIKDNFIINYLSRAEQSLIPRISFDKTEVIEEKFKDSPFAGFYKVYAYGRIKSDETCITVSILEIQSTGFVNYNKSNQSNKSGTFGYIEKPDLALRIHLEDQQTRRTGVMTIYVGKFLPETGRIYTGTFNGVSYSHEIPLATRVVLEYIGTEEPAPNLAKKVSLQKIKDSDINPQIAKILAGKSANFLSFINGTKNFSLNDLARESDRSTDFVSLYLENAKYHLLVKDGDYSKAASMLYRAYKHGMSPEQFAQFKTECADYPKYNLITNTRDFEKVDGKLNP